MSATGFSVVRFSPDPEDVEHVAVGLIVWSGEPTARYYETFPKLACVAGGFSREAVAHYLEYLAVVARDLPPLESHHVLNRLNAQFQVLPFREAQVSDRRFLAALEKRLLSAHEHRKVPRVRRPRLDLKLERVLSAALPALKWIPRVAPHDIYPLAAAGPHPPKIARAIHGPLGVLLLDAVDVSAARDDVHQRAGRVSHALFAFERAHQQAAAGELRRVALVLGESADAESRERTEWVRAALRERTDAIVAEQDVARRVASEVSAVGA